MINILTGDCVGIFVRTLFLYFMKREPYRYELKQHIKQILRFKNIETQIFNFENNHDFKLNGPSRHYSKVIITDDQINSYLYSLFICIHKKYPQEFELNQFISDYKNIYGSDISNMMNNYKNSQEIFLNFNDTKHAGHVFARIIYHINKYNKDPNEGKLVITTEYHQKYRHIFEFMDMTSPNNYVVCDDTNHYFNHLNNGCGYQPDYSIKHFCTTEMFFGYKNVELKNIKPNIYELISDETTVYESEHINIINNCIKFCNDKHKNEKTHDNIFLVKNNLTTPFNLTPKRGFDLSKIGDTINDLNYHYVDPQNMSLSLLVYLLNNAKNIVTSWNTIMYINKFFFNDKSKVVVLCHNEYRREYEPLVFYNNVFNAKCEKLYFIKNLRSTSVTNELLSEIIKLVS